MVMGDIPMRLRSVTSLRVYGLNRSGMWVVNDPVATN